MQLRKHRPYCVLCALTLVVIGLAPTALRAQQVTGTLLGLVTDSSQAAVTEATVTITEVNTGMRRTMQTNQSGNYVFPTLAPGTYRVAVEKTGFRTTIKAGVIVLVNTTARANLVLEVGAVTESVTVTAEVPILQTDRADTGRVIEAMQMESLPLAYGRSFQAVVNLVPGATRAFSARSEFMNSQGALTTNVNGGQQDVNSVRLEGVSNVQRTGMLTVLIPAVEALESVDVSTGNYDAEIGNAGGAATNITLKSGTNTLHGAAYWFNNNSALAARDTFATVKPPSNVNSYGFNLGGPIRRNKTFFFGDFLQSKDRSGSSTIISVPTAEFRAGNFSSQTQIVYDPATGNRETGVGRLAFSGNRVPDIRISAIAKNILPLVPLPNYGSDIIDNYTYVAKRSKDSNQFDVKIDNVLGDKDRLSVRYSFQRPVIETSPPFSVAAGGGLRGTARTQSAGITYAHVFSPTFLTDARFGVSRFANLATNMDSGTNSTEAIGIKGVNLDKWTSGMTSISGTGYTLVGTGGSYPWNRAETSFDYVTNWVKLAGSHSIKFGADFRRIRDMLLQTSFSGGPRGTFTFNNQGTAIPGSRTLTQVNALSSFLLDVPNRTQRDLAPRFPSLRVFEMHTYIQDKWQVTRRLTLDIGLRHELYPPYTPEQRGGFSNYDPATNSLIVAGYGDNPMNLGRKTYYTDFAPRLGVAYRVNDATVMRAGYGISWVLFHENIYAWDNYPVKQSIDYAALGSYGQSQSAGTYLSMGTGFPAPVYVVIPANGIIVADTPYLLAQNITAMVPLDYRESYVQSYNVSLQRRLPKNFTLEVAYVGNLTIRNQAGDDFNAGRTLNAGAAGRPLYQKFRRNTNVIVRYAGYTGSYNSLQVKLDRRFSGGLLVTTAYTWGKTMGYTRGDIGGGGAEGLWNYVQPWRSRGRPNYDRTHTFVQGIVYELPFGKGKPWLNSGVGRWVLGDWQLSTVLSLMTGRPMTFTTTVSPNTPNSTLTPDQIGPITRLHGVAGPGGSGLWFDTSAFTQPYDADGKTIHWGNLGVNNFDGPGLGDLDFSLSRKFSLTERVTGQLRIETFNLTNTPAFNNPNTQLGSATFGKVTQTLGMGARADVGGTGPRQIQLGLKFNF